MTDSVSLKLRLINFVYFFFETPGRSLQNAASEAKALETVMLERVYFETVYVNREKDSFFVRNT